MCIPGAKVCTSNALGETCLLILLTLSQASLVSLQTADEPTLGKATRREKGICSQGHPGLPIINFLLTSTFSFTTILSRISTPTTPQCLLPFIAFKIALQSLASFFSSPSFYLYFVLFFIF
jgi:hypothetical protein